MPDASPAPAEATAVAPVGGAESAAARVATNPATGEPRRPWTAWTALTLLFAGAAVAIAALLLAMWTSVYNFPEAAWLNRAVPTALGDPLRALLVTGLWVSAVLVAGVATTVGYYCWAGYAWTRWGALVSVVVGCLSFLSGPWAPCCLAPLALGAGFTWLPQTRRFFAAWSEVRHPAVAYPPLPDAVAYGPLPRYV